MIELIIGIGASIVISVMGYLFLRAISGNDKEILEIEKRVVRNEDKIHEHELNMLKMSGRIDTILELLERVEESISRGKK